VTTAGQPQQAPRFRRVATAHIRIVSELNYWIGVVSRSHVRLGVEGGFMQLSHGKSAPLKRLQAGDRLVMYSPRTSYPDGEVLQSFTAIGVVASGEVYHPAADFALIAGAMGCDAP